MKKILTAILLILGLVGIGYMLFVKKDTNNKQITTDNSVLSKVSDLFTGNSNKECTYSMTIESVTTSGHMYISGKKMFNTATLKMADKEQSMNYLLDGDWMYSWGDGIPSMKMNIKEMEDMAKDTKDKPDTEDTEDTISYDKLGLKKGMDIDCKEWNVDNSVFEIPADIQFQDITQTLNNFNKMYEETTQKVDTLKEDMCGACNMTPDEQTKKECLVSLGCM